MNKITSIFYSTSFMYKTTKKYTVLFIVVKVLSIVVSLAEVFAIKYLVDSLNNWSNNQISDLISFIALLAIIMYLSGLLGMFSGISMSKLQETEIYEKERAVLEKTVQLKMIDIESPKILDLRERANQYSPCNTFTNGIDLIVNIIQIAVLLLIIIVFGHWSLSLVLIIVFLLQLLAQTRSSRSLQNLDNRQTESKRRLEYTFNLLTDRGSSKEIRLFNISSYLKDKWNAIMSDLHFDTMNYSKRSEIIKLLPNMLLGFIGGVIILAIVIVVKFRNLGIGDFTLLLQVARLLIGALSTSTQKAGVIETESIKCKDFRDYQNLSSENIKRFSNGESSFDINVEDLSFIYPDSNQAALKDVSFKINSGQSVAVVGHNGSGKTTLIKLLLGYYEPTSGEIDLIHNGQKNSIADIRESTSAVFQEYIKLNTNVRENISLSDINKLLENDSLIQAIEGVKALNDFPDLDESLGASFGEREPSGGQWQKLANARAYLRQSHCIIFDEPTASLDPKAELEILKTFIEFAKDKTAILVTHRLGAAQYADWILVLKDGRLIEQGTHHELLNNEGEYNRLFMQQMKWYA